MFFFFNFAAVLIFVTYHNKAISRRISVSRFSVGLFVCLLTPNLIVKIGHGCFLMICILSYCATKVQNFYQTHCSSQKNFIFAALIFSKSQ